MIYHRNSDWFLVLCFITAEKGGVARANGEGGKEKECTTECKSRRRRDEKAPWALNYGSGEGGGVETHLKGGGDSGEEARSVRCMCDVCVWPMATGFYEV